MRERCGYTGYSETMSSTARESWRVRIRDGQGGVHGAGVLVTSEHVLTCAHVVARAVGADPSGRCPDGSLVVDFPGCSSTVEVSARPLKTGWAPVAGQRGDVAVLALVAPPPGEAAPAPLRPSGSSYPHSVRAFGHPRGEDPDAGIDAGRWIRAGLLGTGGPGAEWIQMVGDHVTGGAVDGGFSGAGVVAEDGSVIGCVVAYDLEVQAKIAWMVPIEVMANYWIPLVRLINPAPARELVTAEERHRLITLLFAVTDMRNRAARGTYLDQLQRRYRRLVIDRSPDDFTDVGAVVDACMREPGAFHDLVAALAVHSWNPDDQDILGRLQEVLSTLLPAPLLSQDEREQLFSLLDSAGPAEIADGFRAAVAPFGHPGGAMRRDPAAAVSELEARNTAPGSVPPLIEFAERIALRLAEPHRSRLWRWSDQVCRRLDIQSSVIMRLRSRLSAAPASTVNPAYFVTRLEPDAIDPSRYLLTIWLQHGQSPGIPLRQEEAARPVEEIRQLVDESFTRAPAYAAEDIGPLIVEFVLPSTLLGLPVDQWHMGARALPHGVGLIIRSCCAAWNAGPRSASKINGAAMTTGWHGMAMISVNPRSCGRPRRLRMRPGACTRGWSARARRSG